jgi:hypothetical protein
MQNLGLSSSTPETESRWKTLFWPTIRFDTDVDLITRQGFWVCTIVAALTAVLMVMQSQYWGLVDSLFYFLGGIGSRRRSRFAAIVIFAAYCFTSLLLFRIGALGGGLIVRAICTGLLLSNVRATWLAAKWPASESVPAEPVMETWADKFADRLPAFLWPKTKWLFYILTALVGAGLVATLFAPR